jgi:LmbE family N-acetylglucosaminyl deacetylase
MLAFSEIDRALVVMAHPDDVDFGAAGTVAAMTDVGIEVVYCIVTDGQAGGFDPTIPRDEMASIRRQEQAKAGSEVGVTDIRFLGRMDGTVEVDLGLRHDLGEVIRQVRPQVVITQSPIRDLDSTYRSHPDHLATAEATMCAVYPDARNPFAFAGSRCAALEPWTVSEVWITFAGEHAVPVDITAQLERKIRALMAHVSQHPDPDGLEQRVRTWWQEIASRHGLPAGSSAECFRVVDTR